MSGSFLKGVVFTKLIQEATRRVLLNPRPLLQIRAEALRAQSQPSKFREH